MVYQTTNTRKLKVGSVDVRVALYSDTEATMETAVSVGVLKGITGKHTGTPVAYEPDNAEDIDLGVANEQYEVGASEWANIDLEVLHLLTGQVGEYEATEDSKSLSFGGGGLPKPLHVWLVHTNAEGETFVVEIYKVTSITGPEFSFGSDKARDLLKMPITLVGKPDGTRNPGDQLYKITDSVTVRDGV